MSSAAPSSASAREILRDSFERIRELVESVCDGLDPEIGRFRVGTDANPPAWLIWHLTRVQDDHVAELADVDQIWPRWLDRFELPFPTEATGYGQSPDDTGLVRVDGSLLAGYHAEVHAMTLRYIASLDDAELARIVDERWDPPVTASARLVSVIGDCLQHLGQADYVLGIWRAGR